MAKDVAGAIESALTSPNEDADPKPANVVDGLMAIARAIEILAMSVDNLARKIDA